MDNPFVLQENDDGTYAITGVNDKSITSVAIPNNVTEIGWYAFKGCSSLKNIEIPDSVKIIGEHAFSGCSSLTHVEIPNSVQHIWTNPFSDCSSLESIVVAKDNAEYRSEGNCLIDTEFGYVFAGCRNSVIPNDDSIDTIWESAFQGCRDLKSIVIPDNVRHIRAKAFYNCSSLSHVEIPRGIWSIGYMAFLGCDSLKEIVIPYHCDCTFSDFPPDCKMLLQH